MVVAWAVTANNANSTITAAGCRMSARIFGIVRTSFREGWMVTPIGRAIKRIFGGGVFHRRPVVAAAVVVGPVAAWLLLAAVLVDIEYYDGRSAICNARYFLGRSSFYLFDRGPVMGWLQMPAELVKDWLRLHPLEVRPHHVTMALLHVGYLLAVWGALVRQLGQRWSTFIA